MAAALVVGGLCSCIAMKMLASRSAALAALFLTLAVCSTHFIAMGSITVTLTGGIDIAPLGISRSALVAITSGACLLILGLAIAASILDQHFTNRLAVEATRFRALADATFEGFIFERDGRVFDTNRAMCELAETTADQLNGRLVTDLVPGLDLRLTDGRQPVEHLVRLASGEDRPVEVLWRDGPDRGGPNRGGHIIAVRDIFREKAAESHIARLGQFDPLTGLTNRQVFEQKLQQALALADRTKYPLPFITSNWAGSNSLAKSMAISPRTKCLFTPPAGCSTPSGKPARLPGSGRMSSRSSSRLANDPMKRQRSRTG